MKKRISTIVNGERVYSTIDLSAQEITEQQERAAEGAVRRQEEAAERARRAALRNGALSGGVGVVSRAEFEKLLEFLREKFPEEVI